MQKKGATTSPTQTWARLEPSRILIALLIILSWQVSITRGDTYWTYYPNLPTVIPATWDEIIFKVWVNTSYPLEGEVKNVQPQRVAFNYTGLTHKPPLWASHMPVQGCLKLGKVVKTDGRFNATTAGVMAYFKYHNVLSFVGPHWGRVSNYSKPPPLPSCYDTTIDTNKNIQWNDCRQAIATRHQLYNTPFYIYDWSVRYSEKDKRVPFPGVFTAPVLITGSHTLQKEIWRLWAASDYVNHSSFDLPYNQNNTQPYAITACVQAPEVLLVGDFQIRLVQSL